MTKIPSGEERVESLQVTSKLETNEQYLERVQKIMQQDRLALLTELRDSGLLEEKEEHQDWCKLTGELEYSSCGCWKDHNTAVRNIKELLEKLSK